MYLNLALKLCVNETLFSTTKLWVLVVFWGLIMHTFKSYFLELIIITERVMFSLYSFESKYTVYVLWICVSCSKICIFFVNAFRNV